MTGRIDTLSIRCRGPRNHDGEIDRVRHRLSNIARQQLPAALDLLLPDADVEITTVHAPLEFSLDAYDDDTIAWRWAAGIAAAVTAQQQFSPSPTTPEPSRSSGPPSSASERSHSAAPQLSPPPRPALVVSPAGVLAWLDQLDADLAAVVVRRILQRKVRSEAQSGASGNDPSGNGQTQATRPADAGRNQADVRNEDLRANASSGQSVVEEHRDTIDRTLQSLTEREMITIAGELDAIARAHQSNASVLAPAASTGSGELRSDVGGLVLLYPWLGRLIERGWAVMGDRPETGVAILADLVRSDATIPGARWDRSDRDLHRRVMARDSLVKLLVGTEPGADLDIDLVASLSTDKMTDEIAEVHARFAAAIRGAWSTQLLVDQLLWRDASITDAADVWIVTPAPGPLDHLLVTLPYPLGSFALGWTRPISMRWANV